MKKASEPLYKKIFSYYRDRIVSGEIGPGNRLPSENEISEIFKVSRITVSRALSELELAKLIYRRKGSGSYVCDVDLTSTDDKFVLKDPSFISLVLPTKGDFASDILRGVEEIASLNGFFVTFHNSAESPDLEKEIINDVITRGSNGVIVYPLEPSGNMDVFSKLMISRYPFVLIDRNIPGLEAPLVWADNRKSFHTITKHLIDLGHTRIAFLGTSVFEVSSETERYKGFCAAHIDAGVPLLHRNLYGTKDDFKDIPDTFMPGKESDVRAANFFFDTIGQMDVKERPTAIAAVNDQIASLLVSVAVERGISIPGEYSITGFDDLPYASHLAVPLTTVAQPAMQIGKLAAIELFARIKNRKLAPSVKTVEPHLIIRESTARPSHT